MVMETVVTDISHLDFDVDDERIHYQHPTERHLAWCGAPLPDYGEPSCICSVEEITCEGCIKKYMELGGNKFWDLRGRGEEFDRIHREYVEGINRPEGEK